MPPVHLGVSRCLLGERVRYDGAHKACAPLLDLPPGLVRLTVVCPEVEAGLPVPREPMALDAESRLFGLRTGAEYTENLMDAARTRLATLAGDPPEGWILKARSPSCGVGTTLRGPRPAEDGLFAEAVSRTWPEVPRVDEEALRDSAIRAQFFEALRSHRRVRARSVASVDALERLLSARLGSC